MLSFRGNVEKRSLQGPEGFAIFCLRMGNLGSNLTEKPNFQVRSTLFDAPQYLDWVGSSGACCTAPRLNYKLH